MTRMEIHVQTILEQLQSSAGERDGMHEELLSHLQEAKQHYLNEGFTDEQAEERAVSEFGDPKLIGRQLQESLYPYQRGLLYGIGIGMIAFAILFYLNIAFFLHDTSLVWLAVQLILGGAVTLFAMNIAFAGRHAYGVSVTLLAAIIWNGFNVVIMQSMPVWQALCFSIYLLLLIILGFIAVIRHSYYASDLTESERPKRGLVLTSYVVNLLLGSLVSGISLFFLWALLAFSEDGASVFWTLSPLPIWLVTYRFQMGYIAKRPLIAIATGVGFSVLAVAIPLLIFMGI
ncbi:hypothetical protein GCM10028778_26820 [Barrientosiimonas marina]|uniref:Permease prefix domain 1-containing protein n=1 Tax=Lentibacillus kimchii TaxID=1542911 RepID=A0ABW2UW08_9BACI